MRILFIVLSLCFTAGAYAQDTAGADARSSAFANNFNQNQINTFGNGGASQSVFSKGQVSCESPKVVFGAVGQRDDYDFYGAGDSNNASVGLSLVVPFGKTIQRCKQMQATIARATEAQHEWEVVSRCITLQRDGFKLDPVQFPWAAKCEGVSKIQ